MTWSPSKQLKIIYKFLFSLALFFLFALNSANNLNIFFDLDALCSAYGLVSDTVFNCANSVISVSSGNVHSSTIFSIKLN